MGALLHRNKWLFSLAFLLASCGQGTGLDENQTSQENKPLESQNAPHPKLKSFVASDLLGGMFFGPEEIEAITMQSNFENFSVGKLSINLPPPAEEKVTAQIKPFAIDSSFSFPGKGGAGRLTLSALGKGEELISSSDSSIIRHFESLNFRFLFFKYAFENKCLGPIRLVGEIHCAIKGDYELASKNFSGEAHCISGPEDNPKFILYITKEKNYEVAFDAYLTIEGDPFLFKSYSYEGEITIDGEQKKIQDVMKENLACS